MSSRRTDQTESVLNGTADVAALFGATAFDTRTENRSSTAFARWSLLSIACYVVMSVAFRDPGLCANKLQYNVLACIVSALLIVCYRKQYVIAKASVNLPTRIIVLGALVASAVAFTVPAFFSEDVFCYINTGWIQAQCQQNPYVSLIADAKGFGTDPMFTDVWALNPCPYGFAFAWLAKQLCAFSHGNKEFAVLLFKTVNWMAYVALSAIVFAGAKSLKLRADLSTLLFMWNPLLLIHAISNAHNDMLMALFVMLGYLTAFAGPALLAIPSLVVAALVKYLWALAIPFAVLFLLRTRGLLTTALSCIAGAVTFALVSGAYLADWQNFRWDQIALNINQNCNSLVASLQDTLSAVGHFAFKDAVWFGTTASAANTAVRLVLFGTVAAITGWALIRSVIDRNYLTRERLIHVTLLATFLMVSFVSGKFYSWYQLMYLPVALWLPETSRLRNTIIILSCTQLFGMTFLGKAHIINFWLLTGLPMLYLLTRKSTQSALVSRQPVRAHEVATAS